MNEIKLEKRTEGERQAYLEGFEAGKRTGICIGQRTEWIPASDGLPDDDEEVIVTAIDDKGLRVVGACVYMLGSWYWWSSGERANERITAWQPLPEPYEGGE